MATYIALINWTDQGVRTHKDSVERAESASQLAEKLGGSMDEVYWTVGPYDIVVRSQFPDDETATAFLLAVGEQGNVRTTSMRAFDADEMRAIEQKLS